ncbi:MAG: Bug family tripartite tricarboxylate transporter substrate binding protein [Phyllobacterium sp.]
MGIALLSKYLKTAVAAAAIMAAGISHAAAEWPEKPVRWMMGFAPGGGADTTARMIAAELAKKWKQPVIIENKPGAGGTIAADVVAKSPPDGYTINFATLNHSVTPSQRELTFDPIADFAPVIKIGKHPGVLVVNPSLQVNSVKEFIDYAKAHPGELNYGSTGSDSPYLSMEMFKKDVGIDVRNVKYVSSGPVIVSLLGNEIQAAFAGVEANAELITSGKLKALAITATAPVGRLPDVPTLASEIGAPEFDEGTWYGVLAPAKTPDAIIDKMNKDIAEVLKMPEIHDRMAHNGFIFETGTPAEFSTFLKTDIEKWAALLKSIGSQ